MATPTFNPAGADTGFLDSLTQAPITRTIRVRTKDGAIVECFGVYPNQVENLIGSIEKQTLEQFSKMADSHRYQIISRENTSPLSTKDIDPHSRQVGGDHYKSMGVEPWKAIKAWLTPEEWIGFLRGNIIKYQARANAGKGSAYENLSKAQHYTETLQLALEEQKQKEESMKPK